MARKKKAPAMEEHLDVQVTFTVRLRPSLIKRVKLAATLLEIPVQMVVSNALVDWLREHEREDQAALLHRYAALRKKGLKP